MPSTVLVTGASRGLGLELVRQYRARGDAVIAAVRSRATAQEAAAAGAEVIELDVGNPESIAAAVASLGGRPIDTLINNAGVSGDERSIGSLTFSEFQRVFGTNTFGPALLSRALLPNVRAGRGRRIVNITSQLGSITNARAGFSYAYCSSKAALNMVTAIMAKELAADGVIAVAICPGWNRTDMGGSGAPLAPQDTMRSLIAVVEALRPQDSGRYMSYDGTPIPW